MGIMLSWEEIVVNSLQAAIEAAKEDDNTFILGGATIYEQGLDWARKLDITLVHESFEADVFFPEIDPKIWVEVSREDHKASQLL